MRRAARCFGASLSLLSLFASNALGASPAELDWRAPAGCPTRDLVLSEVERLVVTAPAEPLRARAVVTARRDGFEVRIELAGAAHGARTLRAHT